MECCIWYYGTVVMVKVMQKFAKLYMLCYVAVFDEYIMLWVYDPWEWNWKNLGQGLSARGPSQGWPRASGGRCDSCGSWELLWREALAPSIYHGNPQILDGILEVQMGRVRTLWGTPVDVRRPPEPIAPGNNRVEYRIRFLDGIDSHRCG